MTDEMLGPLGVAGTPEEARDQLEDVAALAAIDEPLVVIPDGTDEELRRETMEALGPTG